MLMMVMMSVLTVSVSAFFAACVIMFFAVVMLFMFVIMTVLIFVIFFCAFFKFRNPPRAFKNRFKIKASGRKQIFNRNFAACRFYHFYVRLKFVDYSAYSFHLVFSYQVLFIDDERGAKFNLLNNQRFNRFFLHILFD